ncbi:MAG: aminodeoxychorismate/anthranilate synthase component II [Planctomycetota bacterium]
MILVIDNYDSFTWNLVQRLGEIDPALRLDEDLVVARNDKITPAEAEALDGDRGPERIIVSPGPCTPNEAGASNDVIAHFAGKVPILGVCLGHQCMAASDGMSVRRHTPVHGKTGEVEHDGKGVFAGLPSPMTATRYHSLIVPIDTVPPPPKAGEDGWEVSAWTIDPDGTKIVMGLRRVWADGSKAPVEGVQFHPESFLTEHGPDLLKNFLDLPSPALA